MKGEHHLERVLRGGGSGIIVSIQYHEPPIEVFRSWEDLGTSNN